jgi:hypothetical protein
MFEGEVPVTKTIAWHAEKDSVYHDNNKCQQAYAIQATKRVKGTAERPQCAECESLDQAAK